MIFDAGVLLAILYDEPGAAKARERLPDSKMAAVNRAEVITVLVRDGMSPEEADAHVEAILSNILPLDTQQSTLIGSLWPSTAPLGLSLGDRACLALGLQLHEPILTTDRSWKKLNLGLELHFLR